MFDFLTKQFSSIFSNVTGKKYLTEQNMQEAIDKVKDALLEADVPYELVESFVGDIKVNLVGQKVLSALKPGEQFIKIVHEQLKKFLGGKDAIDFAFQLPSTVMVMGLQGSGKTTSIAKMAFWAQAQAQKRGKTRRILLGSVDFYRPAAIDQLEILAKQVAVSFYRSTQTDPVKAAKEIQAYAKKELFELLFLDTAGRLHIDGGMMQELKNISAAVDPKYTFLVLDAMTGQESLAVARAFDEGVGYQSAILTKMDSDTRGGAAFAFKYAQKKSIIFVGFGEKSSDFDLFHPDRMAGRILGMGDVLSLIEKAESNIKEADQESLYASLSQGRMTLQDFANQISMVSQLGSLTELAKYLPGIGGGMKFSQESLLQGERELKKFRAIISSMTPQERGIPKILDGARKQRIARGSGTAVSDINLLLERFEQSQQYAKLFKRQWRNSGHKFK